MTITYKRNTPLDQLVPRDSHNLTNMIENEALLWSISLGHVIIYKVIITTIISC